VALSSVSVGCDDVTCCYLLYRWVLWTVSWAHTCSRTVRISRQVNDSCCAWPESCFVVRGSVLFVIYVICSYIHIHIHIKFKTRANMITWSRQSKHTYALVYGVHRAIYITVYVLWCVITLRAKLSVYCNRSCLWVCLFVCVCGCVWIICILAFLSSSFHSLVLLLLLLWSSIINETAGYWWKPTVHGKQFHTFTTFSTKKFVVATKFSFLATLGVVSQNLGCYGGVRFLSHSLLQHRTAHRRFGVAVTRWSRSTQLLYIEPG